PHQPHGNGYGMPWPWRTLIRPLALERPVEAAISYQADATGAASTPHAILSTPPRAMDMDRRLRGGFRRAGFQRLLLLLAHFLDAVPFLDGAQRLEGTADDAVAVLEACGDFDVQLARQPRRDRHEMHAAARHRVDAFLRLYAPRRVLLAV